MKKIYLLLFLLFASCGMIEDIVEEKVGDISLPPQTINVSQNLPTSEFSSVVPVAVYAFDTDGRWQLAILTEDGCSDLQDIRRIFAYTRENGVRREWFVVLSLEDVECYADVLSWNNIIHMCDEPWCGPDTFLEIEIYDSNDIVHQIFISPS